MRFPPSFLDEIRARLPVSDVVRRRVKLHKSGRELVGLSPFGQERTPSFFVNDQKMAWFDFSSGKNGNIFDFVMETEGLSFPETVERLAQEAGLALPARSPEADRQEQRRAGLYDVLEWAAAFFERELAGSRGGKARAYLDGRGISGASRANFRIGYAPGEKHALRDALAAKGATVEVMCEAGLLIHGEDIAVPYDRFRDRLMFPIADRTGRTVAFGGRALEKDAPAKYLNSPETPLFRKGHMIFNHHRARKAAHDAGRVIAVEGYIDVVAMDAAGYAETVAGLGTALTEEQASLLWAMAPQPILCFDGDKAGRKAAYRAADMALPLAGPTRTLSFALLPDGLDPDELIRSVGKAAMNEALASALPLVDLLWKRETEARALATPEQRAGLERDLAAVASAIRDENLRRYYRQDFGTRLRALFGTAENRDRRPSPRGSGQRRPFQPGAPALRQGYLSAPVAASASLADRLRKPRSTLPPRETIILLLLLAHPSLIADHAEEVAAIDFGATDARAREFNGLRDLMLDWMHDEERTEGALREHATAAGFATLLTTLEQAGGSAWYLRPDSPISDAAHVLRQALTLHHKARTLHKELLSAEAALATNACEANIARMRDIQEQLNALAGIEAAVEGFGALSGRSGTSL